MRFNAFQLGTRNESVVTISNDHLNPLKVSARWVLRILMPEQKRNQIMISLQMLVPMIMDPEKCMDRTVIHNELWVSHFDLEIRT